jgi:hypothetical protein
MGQVKKPEFVSASKLPGSEILKIKIKIDDKVHTYYINDSVPLQRILRSKYFSFHHFNWIKTRQIYIQEENL